MVFATHPPISTEGFIYDSSSQKVTSGLPTQAAKSDSSTGYETNYDVIVEGAGFTGLVAARDLALAGKNVLLIEARDRIGGRTWTANALEHNFEMGGTWFHWFQPHIWAEISRYGLSTNVTASTGFEDMDLMTVNISSEGTEPTPLSQQEADNRLLPLMKKFFDVDGWGGRSVMKKPHEPLLDPESIVKYDFSIVDRINQLEDVSQKDKDFMLPWLAMQGLCAPADVGFLQTLRTYALANFDFATFVEMNGRWKFTNGTTELASLMYNEFKGTSLFKRPIESIKADDRAVQVTTRGGETFTAWNLICTIPLHCLSDVEFSPALPDCYNTISHVNFGGKVHLRTKDKVPAWFGVAESTKVSFGFTESFTESGCANIVTFGMSPGSDPQPPVAEKPKEYIDLIKTDLFPHNVAMEVRNMVWHDWVSDEYAKGSWAVYGPGQLSQSLGQLMISRKLGRITMASGDWADGWAGYIDGAIEQGRQAAWDLIQKA